MRGSIFLTIFNLHRSLFYVSICISCISSVQTIYVQMVFSFCYIQTVTNCRQPNLKELQPAGKVNVKIHRPHSMEVLIQELRWMGETKPYTQTKFNGSRDHDHQFLQVPRSTLISCKCLIQYIIYHDLHLIYELQTTSLKQQQEIKLEDIAIIIHNPLSVHKIMQVQGFNDNYSSLPLVYKKVSPTNKTLFVLSIKRMQKWISKQ